MSQTFESFGKYILLEKLATGGMAEVYLGKNMGAERIGKFVAIKRILPQFSENPEFIDMFKDEAKIAVNLAHSNIVSIHEFGIEKNQFFLVMDFVEGRNLRQILNKMKKSGLSFAFEQVLYIVKEVAAGLDHAHRCLDAASGKPLLITHRDMSPQNVMISFEGEVKVVDFGIAKAETQIETTRAGTLKGKFGYMSPEQAEGQIVDLRTDIFSLGIVLWELLANDRLFVANNEINTLRKIRDCQIPSLRKVNPNIPPELERICNKALARDRNLRYQTAAAFHRELNRFLNRQYPDFSPHDFSVFIKTLFASEILEHRKKIVDYSKIDSQNLSLPQASGSLSTPTASGTAATRGPNGTIMTSATEKEESGNTSTSSNAYFANTEFEAPSADRKKTTGQKSQFLNDTPELTPEPKNGRDPQPEPKRRPQPAVPRPASTPAAKFAKGRSSQHSPQDPRLDPANRHPKPGDTSLSLSVHEGTFSSSTYSDRSYRSGNTYANATIYYRRSRFTQLLQQGGVGIVIAIVLAFGVYYTMSPKDFSNRVSDIKDRVVKSIANDPDTSARSNQNEQASIAKLKVSIVSTPPVAEIWIDGALIRDVTPTTHMFEAGREYAITIRKDGFSPWQQRMKFTHDGDKLSVILPRARIAFVDIVVVGSGEIYVNNKRIANAGPVQGHQIPADEDVIIRSYDSRTGASAEERVRLGEGFSKKVILYPKIRGSTAPLHPSKK